MITRKTAVRAAAALAAIAAATGTAHADGPRSAALSPEYVQECGACHVAFPPALLSSAAWQRVLAGLAKHYGTDASLDAAARERIGAWLAAHGATGRRANDAPPEDRITRSAWFQREHREVAAATWKQPSVKSAANCAACHPKSEQGNYDEHQVRIPR